MIMKMENRSLNEQPFGEPIKIRLPFFHPDIECIQEPQHSNLSHPYHESLITFIEEDTYQRICAHAESDMRNEVGGALLGKYCKDNETDQCFNMIFDVFPAKPEVNENFSAPALMRFTHTFFIMLDEYLEEVNRKDPEIIRLGMYHSHPGYTVFMSSTDIETFRTIFFEPWHISLIIDPINSDAGVFFWHYTDQGSMEIGKKTGFTLFKSNISKNVQSKIK